MIHSFILLFLVPLISSGLRARNVLNGLLISQVHPSPTWHSNFSMMGHTANHHTIIGLHPSPLRLHVCPILVFSANPVL
ncbi:uncharacterized protein B0I36DRAFT_317310 [Microdochium trichocladiopsis]|uniref:Secreted protein n=1 Tax=Microdochium trichocladiopsis TaxID=1682393 RepID=A0A9P8YDH9_9PEZI|nr:uncharacterized protein B0I36DRAFT_317310 [Microdochium trichocladiopsis]KAH7034961.1 hypothetical protein B0I36DRAFT_317310 [Microdochium trichocladiopsis]